MQMTHALNLYDSLHTMPDMESLKLSPEVSSIHESARRTTRQSSAIGSRQGCQQQQSQQQ